MTRTLTLNATVQLDGATITLDLDRVDLDAGQPLVLDVLARVLGLDRIDHPAGAAPERVTDLTGTAERAPVVTAAPVTDEDREYLRSPERIKAPAKKAPGPRSGAHAPGQFAAPGTKLRSILDAIADHGGRWEGTQRDLTASVDVPEKSASQMVRQLTKHGLVTVEKRPNRMVAAIALTGDGWAHLGRGKPTDIHSLVLTPPEPPATSDAPKVIDLATLPREGRKPFDHDAARNAAASAL